MDKAPERGDPIFKSHREEWEGEGAGKELDPRSDSRQDSLPPEGLGLGGLSVMPLLASLPTLTLPPEPGPGPGCSSKSVDIISEHVPVVLPGGTIGFTWMQTGAADTWDH